LAPLTGGIDSGSWQTPVSDDSVERVAGKFNSRGEPKLSAQVKWATHRASERCDYQYDRGDHNSPRLSLSGQVKQWPTPDANAMERTNRSLSPGAAIRPTLALAVKWPTPTKQDASNTTGPLQFKRNTPPLNVATHGGTKTPRMSLNPDWVEWLMGWSIGWTDLKPLETARFRQWFEQHG